MKNFLCLVLVLLLAVSQSVAAGYSRPIRESIEAIRKDVPENGLPRLHGYAAGFPGYVGAYKRCFPKIYGNATMQDVELMLKDPSSVIRLVGAMVVINHGLDPHLYMHLAMDPTVLSVGPFHRTKPTFREMKVSEVLTEMQHDPGFMLNVGFGETVRLDYIREKTVPAGAKIVLGKLPEYPFDMARAGITGDVIAKVTYQSGTNTPAVQILKASHLEFAEAITWALSRWELQNGGPDSSAGVRVTEFECRFVFEATE